MGIGYLHDKSWVQITREERQFCAALFGIVRKKPEDFIQLLNRKAKSLRSNSIALDDQLEWEVGFEVALGRDLRDQDVEFLGSQRKFDLVFFSNSHMVVVEAKAQQRYSTEELARYESDQRQLRSALRGIDVIFVGLCSEQYLNSKHRKLDLSKGLDAMLTWKQIEARWPDEHFRRADYVYDK